MTRPQSLAGNLSLAASSCRLRPPKIRVTGGRCDQWLPSPNQPPAPLPHWALLHTCIVFVLFSYSMVSNSLWPHGLEPTRLLCLWSFPGKNTGMDCHFLLQRIFPSTRERTSNNSVQNSLFYFIFVRQTHWFLDHSRGWKPFTNLFIWKYKYKIILSTSVMWETAIHIVIFYNRALRKPHTKTWKMLEIYIYRYIYMYIYKKNTHYQSCHQFHTKV